MKPQIWFLTLFLMILAGAAPFASGETIQGDVALVNLKGDHFKVFAQDPKTGEMKNLDIAVTRGTKLEGVHSILELEVGDDILVDARPTKNGEWKATFVKVPMSEISGEVTTPFAEKQLESWTEKSEPPTTPLEDEEVTPTIKKTNRTP